MIKRIKRFFSAEIRAYSRLVRGYRRRLAKQARNFLPYDWSYLHNMNVTMLKFMLDYYKQGNNVWQTDETLLPIIDQIQLALDKDTTIDNLLDEDFDVEYVKEADGRVTGVFPSDFTERYIANEDAISQCYKDFYYIIGEHIEEWWD